ncbi:MAG: TIGR04283 family arsenosugar biosynthesis glycosyltransferase [Alphaproteobacteria bacterium]|nr:TIGR04283 family arsenosugar biosynthesis glycosyltransferase [Alphaproteobacteria bacterium]
MAPEAKISLGIVVPALNAVSEIGATLEALRAAGPRFDVDFLVVDGGSTDGTIAAAQTGGARTITAPPGRGGQLAAGAASVAGDWLLFVHADTRLEGDWVSAVGDFMRTTENTAHAGYFRLVFDDAAPAARRLERIVAWRARVLGLPYGDQGLLLARDLYDTLGGYRPLVLMEDVDLVRRLGRRRLVALPASARTSAERYRRSGYLVRSARNLLCLLLYRLGIPLPIVRRLYG